MNRNFLWESTCEKRKLHLVGWNKIIKSKEEGGIGIQTLKAKYIALLANLNWRMFHEKESLWAKVILRKYCSDLRRHSVNPDKLPSSPNWKAIMVGFPVFAKGIGWSIGNGEKIRVWQDIWIKGVPLKELIEGPLTSAEYDLKVTDLKQNPVWNWNLISFDLPQTIKDKIKAVPFQFYGIREDTVIWKAAKDREFSTRSTYQLAIPSDSWPPF